MRVIGGEFRSRRLKSIPGVEIRPTSDRLRETLLAAGLKLRAEDQARQKLSRLRSMYEPYVHSMGKRLMLSLPPWQHPERAKDNWQAGPWDRVIQAKSLGALGQRPYGVEDHF